MISVWLTRSVFDINNLSSILLYLPVFSLPSSLSSSSLSLFWLLFPAGLSAAPPSASSESEAELEVSSSLRGVYGDGESDGDDGSDVPGAYLSRKAALASCSSSLDSISSSSSTVLSESTMSCIRSQITVADSAFDRVGQGFDERPPPLALAAAWASLISLRRLRSLEWVSG